MPDETLQAINLPGGRLSFCQAGREWSPARFDGSPDKPNEEGYIEQRSLIPQNMLKSKKRMTNDV
jgi:hypothetical protein